jgi:nucleoside-diphosphate-sugar epimerase
MKVVVTGGSGNIGQYVVRELLQHGHDIVSFDRVASPNPEPNVHYRIGDHEDEGTIFELLAPADAVVHLSAIPAPRTHANALVFRTNVMGAYNVCEAAATLGLKKIVATSSINVLGMSFRYRDFAPHYLPLDEEHPNLPQDPYGLSKVVGEDIVDMAHRRTGIPAVSIRPSHVIMPETWPTRLAALKADPNAYYGGIWGYADVRDLAVGFRLALETESAVQGAYYIVADDAFCSMPIAEAAPLAYPGTEQISAHLTGTESGISNAKAKRELGFQAQYSWRDFA